MSALWDCIVFMVLGWCSPQIQCVGRERREVGPGLSPSDHADDLDLAAVPYRALPFSRPISPVWHQHGSNF